MDLDLTIQSILYYSAVLPQLVPVLYYLEQDVLKE